MKYLKTCFAGVLSAAMLFSTVSAHVHPGEEEPGSAVVSDWAQEEVARAESLGLIPDSLGSDYTVPIDREGFAALAVAYVAEQNNSDLGPFNSLVELVLGERDESGTLLSPFSDVDIYSTDYGIAAYYLGIVQGDDGALYPDRNASRQEAAAVVVRAYTACGGELPEEAAEITFRDKASIQDWAKEDAAALAAWGVMKGDDQGDFCPNDPCTVEAAILMFLRMYENAPVSRENGNVEQMFTYDQYLSQVQHGYHKGAGDMAAIGLSVETEEVTFVQQQVGGLMRASTNYYLVYRDGGIRPIDLGLCGGYNLSSNMPLVEDAQFSDDGKIFTCTLTLSDDACAADGTLLHQGGVYLFTLDVDTLESETVLTGA